MTEQYIKDPVVVEHAKIAFRNFSGRQQKYNPEGIKNFCVVFDPEVGEMLERDGWNIKWFKQDDEEIPPEAYLQVAVSYKNRPPRIIMLTDGGRKKTPLSEKTVGLLDTAEFELVDIIITPYNWEVNGKSGVKAYLKTMYVTLEEDELDRKYADDVINVMDDETPFTMEHED